MKILVAVPVKRGMFYRASLDSIVAMEWDGQLDHLLSIGGDDPESPVDNIVRKYNSARDIVINNGYDALMTVECDIIVPIDAVKRLAAIDADVAYGLYVWRHGWPWWNAYYHLEEKSGQSFSGDLEKAKDAWGNVREVVGVGNGCTLIHRHVLERLSFRKSDFMNYSCDWTFAVDCQEVGFLQKCDFSVICGHIQKEPVPRVLWPDITRRGLYRASDVGPIPEDLKTNALTYLKDTEGTVQVRMIERAHLGDGIIAEPGEVVNLPKKTAKKIVWHGVAEYVEDQPYETSAKFAEQMLKERAMAGDCGGCP